MLGFWLIGRHRGPQAKLPAELADAGPQVNRDAAPLGGGAARGVPRVHQALEGADILAVAPPALEVLPPVPHDDDHDPSPRIESGPDAPVSWGVGYRPAMIGRWPNCGKLMKVTEKSGFFRALPWLAQSGIVRAVFRGRRPARPFWRCRSSVVEHVLGKDGVGSSILLGSTTFFFLPGDWRQAMRFRPHERAAMDPGTVVGLIANAGDELPVR
jgi:hypothetical protein